jgi:glycosyltransferase involved in cell wall biosynthesis
VEAGAIRTTVQRARFALTLKRYGRRIDALTAITEGVRDYAAPLAGWPADRVAVWRSGCTWCEVPPPTPAWPRELPRALRDRFVVLYHGTMTPGRGLFESIQAIDVARTAGADVALVLLGTGSAVPALERLVEERGLQAHVRFVSPVPHARVPEFVNAADVGLVPLPPIWEWQISSPLKLAEYLCLGLPVVLTDIQAHRIVAPDAPFAFWAATADPPGLAAAILDAYRRRSQLPGLGREARAWAEPRLGWSPQLGVLERVLSSLEPAARLPGTRA